MIHYTLEGKTFDFKYQELKDKYQEFIEYDDIKFSEHIVDATHLAIMICFIKQLKTEIVLSDVGIIHELVHLMIDETTITPLEEIRELFKEQLKLS